jgi:hypothetical protein
MPKIPDIEDVELRELNALIEEACEEKEGNDVGGTIAGA